MGYCELHRKYLKTKSRVGIRFNGISSDHRDVNSRTNEYEVIGKGVLSESDDKSCPPILH